MSKFFVALVLCLAVAGCSTTGGSSNASQSGTGPEATGPAAGATGTSDPAGASTD